MQNSLTLIHRHRNVDDHGETLVVRKVEGVNALVDPCDESVVVVVPYGRHAKLVRYTFSGIVAGRDAHVSTYNDAQGFVFVSVVHPKFRVLLQDLSEGQQVDVLPAIAPAASYAFLPRPMPVLCRGVAVEPVYALA